jgi:hypothetical protein
LSLAFRSSRERVAGDLNARSFSYSSSFIVVLIIIFIDCVVMTQKIKNNNNNNELYEFNLDAAMRNCTNKQCPGTVVRNFLLIVLIFYFYLLIIYSTVIKIPGLKLKQQKIVIK